MVSPDTDVQRAPAEVKFASELAALGQGDDAPTPRGWRLSPRAVRRFILGDAGLGVTQKFFGDDALVDRAIVSLMGQQGLMLVGEPGTAKSMLSELLAAAIGGSSTLVVQGSAGVVEDHLRYGWNYALLLAEGPSERAMVPSPLLTAMREGRIARIEELTRCAPEVQDAMISLLSEKTIAVPELGPQAEYRAAPGFNVIATANLRDRGVHDMSSALKRRFNFETVHPIADAAFEKRLIAAQLAERMAAHDLPAQMPDDVLDLVVAVFRELRTGVTADGASVPVPSSVMSTAEAVNTAQAAMLAAGYLDGGPVTGAHVAQQLRGVVFKDDPEDARKLRAYTDQIAKKRGQSSATWAAFHKGARQSHDG
ncbi:ATP-binding protein [Tropicibacter naphthalenivorans]|uniref:Gas vesicle protein GvpN n=1 Tax=Tropicibacter naphthalenivorans TaxID=441103 RepID=A0A0P1G1N9_9RHOB|nr:AAA family ATPase [Tropicibacter naphthalenivorans]CUH75558.1 gas vesicle protein GvpN [Tropicibacter naphthalenivorans]SMC43672.1 AAA domain (dynein-related subfamily) [Tropicibacter naphthalenivorans]